MNLRRLAASAAIAWTSTGCGLVGYQLLASDAAPPDAPPIDAPTDAGPLGDFGPPTRFELVSAVGFNDDDPTLTADQLDMYFNTNQTGGPGGNDIWYVERSSVGSAWSAPAPAPMLNTGSTETTPEISADGLQIWFGSNRTGSIGGDDVWTSTRATRSASSWTMPTRVVELSTADVDSNPTPSPSGLLLMLASNRPGGNGDYEIWRATRAAPSGMWSTPEIVLELSTAVADSHPYPADDATLLFGRIVGATYDLFVAQRSGGSPTYDVEEPIDELNTTSFAETDPWLSPDRRTLYFTSTANGDEDIYIATR